ncbi:hypothetical protein ACN28S_21185 [Cystobacter fuscus]
MKASGLFISCPTAAASEPSAESRSAWSSRASICLRSVTSRANNRRPGGSLSCNTVSSQSRPRSCTVGMGSPADAPRQAHCSAAWTIGCCASCSSSSGKAEYVAPLA